MFLLVRAWDQDLLGVPDSAELDFTDNMMDNSNKFAGGSPVEEEPGSRALRLMVRLGQPFDAFLLAQQRVGEYKRIASDHHIVAQVQDITSVDNMDTGTVEIL
ncbi:hypothetical protein BDR07DRAFT_478567 [Suillus spraguei]|nr:hypothetical protein BDR07DRAFT_478567 [Suillus spraguei]